MERRNVPRRYRSPARLAADLRTLSEKITDDLFVPSLRHAPPRLHGYAFKFSLTLPLFASDGNRVFSEQHLSLLHVLFDQRFGGCSGTSSRSGPPYFGEYLPHGDRPVRDFHTIT